MGYQRWEKVRNVLAKVFGFSLGGALALRRGVVQTVFCVLATIAIIIIAIGNIAFGNIPYRTWRCPSCERFLPPIRFGDMDLGYCPYCGELLEFTPKRNTHEDRQQRGYRVRYYHMLQVLGALVVAAICFDVIGQDLPLGAPRSVFYCAVLIFLICIAIPTLSRGALPQL